MDPNQSVSQNEHTRWFSEEVQPHENSLRSYLTQSLPSKADVDDITQDCYARLLKSREKSVIRFPKAFLFAIARNAVRDFIQKKQRVELVEVTENTVLPVLDDEVGVVESVCRKQEMTLLMEAIDSLPERCREVLILRKINGMPQRQIAELLGISENTVESLASKGARRCADYLRAHGATRKE